MTRRAILQTLAGCFAALRGGARRFRGQVGGDVLAKDRIRIRVVGELSPSLRSLDWQLKAMQDHIDASRRWVDMLMREVPTNAQRSQTSVRTARMS